MPDTQVARSMPAAPTGLVRQRRDGTKSHPQQDPIRLARAAGGRYSPPLLSSAAGWIAAPKSKASRTMRIRGKSLVVLSLLSAMALCGSGCTSLDEIHIPFVDPPVDYSFETAADRMEKYQAQGAAAASKSAQEQEAESQRLAEAFGTEKEALVRGSIALAAARYPTAAAKSVLLAAIRDPDPETRKAGCLAWGRRGGAEGASALSDVLEAEQDRDVRLVAVRALGEIKDPAAVAVLARGLEDSDVAIQHRAMRSLENVTGKYYGNDANLWRQYAQGQDVPEQTPSIAERVKRIF